LAFVGYSWAKPRPLGLGCERVELLACRADELVEARAVAAIDALLELGVDVEGHLGIGVADLAHDPLHIEVVRV
jgi:hypothetical protein